MRPFRTRGSRRGIAGTRPGIWIAVAAIVVAVATILAVLAYGGYLHVPAGGTSGPTAQYNVTFSENGLPSGTVWSITMSGVTNSSPSTVIPFVKENGTFLFQVSDTAGYYANPSSGIVVVNGSAVQESIAFSTTPPPLYNLTFRQSGLPPRITWAITIGSSTESTNTTSLVFPEPNGSYPWVVGLGDVQGYFPSPSYGTATVRGEALTVVITFYPYS